jgi:hypothetical protein
MTRRLTAVLLLVLLVACGGGGDGPGDDVLGPGERDDQAVAEEANLRLSDFPDEWRADPVPAGAEDATAASGRTFAACVGRPPPEEGRTALAGSEDFSSRETRRVSSSAQMVESVEAAVADFEALRTDRALQCRKAQIDAEFLRQLPESAPETLIERLDLPQFGDETVAFRVQAMSLAGGSAVRTYIDLVFVRKGRAQLSASFIDRNTPFPAELQRSLLQRMVGRA